MGFEFLLGRFEYLLPGAMYRRDPGMLDLTRGSASIPESD